jgi:hypothetical protein
MPLYEKKPTKKNYLEMINAARTIETAQVRARAQLRRAEAYERMTLKAEFNEQQAKEEMWKRGKEVVQLIDVIRKHQDTPSGRLILKKALVIIDKFEDRCTIKADPKNETDEQENEDA